MTRIDALKASIGEKGLDALLVTSLTNVRYLSGFTGTSAWMLVTSGKTYFITDSRYEIQAAKEARGCKIIVCGNYTEKFGAIASMLKLKGVGFEGSSVSYDAYRRLKKEAGRAKMRPVSGLVEKQRAIKDRDEVRLIREAIKVAEKGYKSVEKGLLAGKTERQVALDIERAVKNAGADGHSFETIVASGVRSAMPHGTATGKKIKRGEFVIVDMGVALNGYKSDETRTYVVGRPTSRQKKIYDIVKAAHDLAIEAIRPGVERKAVDKAARAYIKKKGFGKCFGHGTGHGVGLDIHEEPSLSPRSKGVLEEGMVVTVEPGIYVQGYGGVRIEDMVLVTADGAEVLTEGEKKMKVLS